MTVGNPKLLLVDSYDSFTHNLAALCRQAIPNCSITIIKNDEIDIDTLLPLLPYFDAVIVGPGPGSPDIDADIGVVKNLWKLKENQLLPIFGVCLGLQSLAIEHGASLKRLSTVKHGLISQIQHHDVDIFQGVGDARATRYHSLHVVLQEGGPLEELAWTRDEENGKVVMAVKHTSRPFWAVQYHPESVCTDDGGLQVVRNFWHLARQWSTRAGRRTNPMGADPTSKLGCLWPYASSAQPKRPTAQLRHVLISTLQRRDISVVDICEAFGAAQEASRFVLLESASQPGRFSIIGALSPSTLNIQYRIGDDFVTLRREGKTTYESLGSSDVWSWLSEFMRARNAVDGNPELPFWGGLIGNLSYELGVDALHVHVNRDGKTDNLHSDVNLVFVERSIVVDATTGIIYVQSIATDDRSWIEETVNKLDNLHISTEAGYSLPQGKPDITFPDKTRYISRIRQAQAHLAAGDSYELCQTAQTRIRLPSSNTKGLSTSWERYKRLRRSNPAPHSAYLRLHPSTFLSSSPERFLSYSRPPGTICQLRPIKGTVRKAPHITRADAEKALVGSPKEVAENLMIVDLIRHDLHGVVGPDVQVKQFCTVEEYETVWQLVSVIEGKLDDDAPRFAEEQLGWKVLKESLPPGSMTGAPKKRSVEILQTLEDQERSLYSGVFGYWCVSGAGDWSVTIRSCFKFEDIEAEAPVPDIADKTEEWVIGAGGAITALSDPEGEWEEMETKLGSVLRAFGVLS